MWGEHPGLALVAVSVGEQRYRAARGESLSEAGRLSRSGCRGRSEYARMSGPIGRLTVRGFCPVVGPDHSRGAGVDITTQARGSRDAAPCLCEGHESAAALVVELEAQRE